MDIEATVAEYIDAWNRKDVDAVLALMHPGAAYYDAFWMESCVGKDLPQYLEDGFIEEPVVFQIVGKIIEIESGCVYRYTAHKSLDGEGSEAIYEGAEVLTFHDGRILTVSDFYCNQTEAFLVEVGRLASKRHGCPAHTSMGVGALRSRTLREGLATFLADRSGEPDSLMPVSQLAEEVGCSVDQLLDLIDSEYGKRHGRIAREKNAVKIGDLL